MTSFPKWCIFIFWANRHTQNMRGWKRWVLVEKINAIWWNIKVNQQKLVGTYGYELQTNLQNFMQKHSTEVKIFQKFLGELLFFWNIRYSWCRMLRQGWSQEPNVVNTSHRYCVNFIGCRSDDELNSRWPAWYTKCCQAKYLAIWLTIFILPQKVLIAPSGPFRGEGALSLVFTVVLVTDVLLQLDRVSGTIYMPVWSQLHRIQKTTENIHVSDGLRRIVTFLIIAPYK